MPLPIMPDEPQTGSRLPVMPDEPQPTIGNALVGQDDDAIMRMMGVDPAVIKRSKLYHPGDIQKHMVTPSESFRAKVIKSPVGPVIQGVTNVASGASDVAAPLLQKAHIFSPEDVAYTRLLTRLYQRNYAETRGAQGTAPLGQALGSALATPGITLEKAGAGAIQSLARRALGSAATGAVAGAVQPSEDQSLKGVASRAAKGAVAGTLVSGALAPVEATVAKTLTTRMTKLPEEVAPQTVTALGEQVRTTPWRGLSEVQRAAIGGQRAREARHLLGEIDKQSQDWHEIVRQSGGLRLLQRKIASDKNYAEAITATGTAPVNIDPILRTLDERINDRSLQIASPDVVARLTKIRNQLTPEMPEELANLPENLRGQAVAQHPELATQPFTFSEVEALRSRVGEEARAAAKQGHAPLASALGDLKGAIDDTQNQFMETQGSPQARRAWEKARTFYKEEVAPYKAGFLAHKLNNPDTPDDEVLQQFIREGKAGRAKFLWNALEDKGRAAVKAAWADEAVQAAMKEGHWDDTAFLNVFKGQQKKYDVFFAGRDKAEMDGLRKMIASDRVLQRSAYLLGRVGYWTSGLTGFGPASMGGGFSAGLATEAAFKTPQLRRILLASSRLRDGSPQLATLAEQFRAYMERMAGSAVAAPEESR